MKPRRIKALAPVQSNAGLQRRLAQSIAQIVRREALCYCIDITRELYHLMTGEHLAMDADPNSNKGADGMEGASTATGAVGAGEATMAELRVQQRDTWNRLQQALKAHNGRIPEDFISKNLSVAEATVLARRLIHAGAEAKSVSGWYVRSLARGVTASQRSQLLRAGVRPDLISEKWKVPVVRNLYISPKAAAGLGDAVTEMTGKIVRLSAEGYANVRGAIYQGLLEGFDQDKLMQRISFIPDFDWEKKNGHPITGNRAQRVALDQTNKVTQYIANANAQALGCTQAEWMHFPGAKSSRPSHEAMDGKTFDLKVGMWDEDVGAYVQPGELPFCRCKARHILPAALFGDVKDET